MRGQGFDVFRLLIAAVVAGAILMILLGLMQGLITPTTDPQTAAAQLVKKYSRYGGQGSTDLIDFRKGMAIDAKAIAREAYLPTECVEVQVGENTDFGSKFNCEDGSVCEYTSNVGTKARIKVRCDSDLPDFQGKNCDIGCIITIER